MFSHGRRVDLLVVQLKAAIRRLLDAKGVRARVLDKVNRYGEVVIGVILEGSAGAGSCSEADVAADANDTSARARAESAVPRASGSADEGEASSHG